MNKTKICGNKKSLILLSSTLLKFSLFFVICSCAPDNLTYKNNSKSLDSLNNQINNKTREINNLNATVSDLQAELDNKNKNKDGQKEIDKSLKKIASLNIENEKLKKQLQTNENTIELLNTGNKNLEIQIQDKDANINKLYNDNIDLNNQLQQNKNTIDSLKTENENLKNQISNQDIDLNKKINNKQACIDSLNNMLNIQKQKNNKLDEIKTCKDNRLNVYTRRYMLWKEISAIQIQQIAILKKIASCNLFQNKYKKKLANEVEKLNREITNTEQKLSDNNKYINTYYSDDVNLQNDLKKLN